MGLQLLCSNVEGFADECRNLDITEEDELAENVPGEVIIETIAEQVVTFDNIKTASEIGRGFGASKTART